jgi:ethanolamine ammonia-lyase large subunit
VLQLLGMAKVVLSTMILFTLMMEATLSYDTSVLTRAIRRHIPEYSIVHNHRRVNLRSYIALTG